MIFGYDYGGWPMEAAIEAFETLPRNVSSSAHDGKRPRCIPFISVEPYGYNGSGRAWTAVESATARTTAEQAPGTGADGCGHWLLPEQDHTHPRRSPRSASNSITRAGCRVSVRMAGCQAGEEAEQVRP